MDIKLGTEHRIRLDEHDFALLQTHRILTQNFLVTEQLSITLTITLGTSESSLTSHSTQLLFNLAETDWAKLSTKEYRKNGILLGNYLIQLDAWSKEKRNHSQID